MSTTFLVDHFPNCTPLTPCVSCRAAGFLKTKLNPDDFEELIKIALDQGSDSRIGLDASVDQMGLPIRVNNCLKCEKIYTVGELLRKTEWELMCIPNFGKLSLRLLREALEHRGRRIGECATPSSSK